MVENTTQTLTDRAHAILSGMPAGWAVMPQHVLDDDICGQRYHDNRAEIAHADTGMTLCLSRDDWRNEGRIRISVEWPRDEHRQIYMPRPSDAVGTTAITVSSDKADVAIGKDIARRLLPSVTPLWCELQARAHANDLYRRRGWAMAQRIATALNGIARDKDVYHRNVSDRIPDEARVDLPGDLPPVHVTGSGASVTVRTTEPELMIHVLQLLQTRSK